MSPEFKAKLSAKIAALTPMPGYVEERSDDDWAALLAPQISSRSLNETKLVRQLTFGQLEFFVRGLAALSKTPYAAVRAGVLAEPPAFAAYWDKALLPRHWLGVAAAAVTAVIQVDRTAGKADEDLFSRNILSRTQANIKAAKITLSDAQRRLFLKPGGIR